MDRSRTRTWPAQTPRSSSRESENVWAILHTACGSFSTLLHSSSRPAAFFSYTTPARFSTVSSACRVNSPTGAWAPGARLSNNTSPSHRDARRDARACPNVPPALHPTTTKRVDGANCRSISAR